MKRILGAAAIVMAGAMTYSIQSSAEELWDPHLRGADEGLAAGALPPPGVYGIVDNYWAAYDDYNSKGKKVPNTGLSALVEVPIVLYNPGIKILGADYAMAIAQPFDYTSVDSGYGVGAGHGHFGTFNTILIPAILSWTLGDFHVSTGVSVYLPDASSTLSQIASHGTTFHGGLPSGNGYTAIQPDFGVSYLAGGWNLSASFHLSLPVSASTDTGYNYWSGNEFAGDYTATKTVGKWTFGLGAHQENQLNSDTQNGKTVANSEAVNYGIGPIVGYQFDGVNVQATWNHNIYTKNDVAGDFFNVRAVWAF